MLENSVAVLFILLPSRAKSEASENEFEELAFNAASKHTWATDKVERGRQSFQNRSIMQK